MKLGEEARRKRLVTVELIPDRASNGDLALLRGRVDAVTIPAIRNGGHDPSYPSGFRVTAQQRSLASAVIVARTGLETVPTLTCRDCRAEDLEGLSRAVDGGVENILAVYGDRYGNAQDEYVFRRTDQLIRRVREEADGLLSVGAITNQYAADTEDETWRTLGRVDAGASFVLTNICFEPEQFREHRDRLFEAGLKVPLLAQVSIPHNLQNLLFVCKKFGIPVSKRVRTRLQRNHDSGTRLAADLYSSLKHDADGVHFSYLLRKQNPVWAYSRLLDLIGREVPEGHETPRVPVTVGVPSWRR